MGYKLIRHNKSGLFLLICWLIGILDGEASDILIQSLRLIDKRVDSGYTHISFHLRWNDAWRTSTGLANHDAVWVFFKCRVGQQDYRSAPGATSVGRIIQVSSTDGIRVGQPVWVESGGGLLRDTTRVLSVLGAQRFEIDREPLLALSGGTTVVATTRIWEPVYPDTGGTFAGLLPDRSWPAARLQAGLLHPDRVFDRFSNPVQGFFVSRRDVFNNRSSYIADSLRFRWNYSRQQIPAEAVLDVQVHAIEMVWIPPGPHSIPINEMTGQAFFWLSTDTTQPHPHNRQMPDEGRHRFAVKTIGSTAAGGGGPLPGSGSCLCFCGDSATLEMPDTVLMPAHTVLTIEAWVWVRCNGVFRVAGNLNAAQNTGFALLADPAQGLWWRIGTHESSPRGSPFPLERWIHLAGVREGSVWRCFINGVPAGSLSLGNTTTAGGQPWRFGGGMGVAQERLHGCMGGIRIYSDSCVYTGGQAFEPDPRPFVRTGRERVLMRFRQFTLWDAAHRHAISTLGASLVRHRNSGSRGVGEVIGDVCFDGYSRLQVIAKSVEWPLKGDATLEFWVRFDSIPTTFQTLVAIPGVPGLQLGVGAEGWLIRLGGQSMVPGVAPPTAMQWQHIAWVRKDSIHTFFVQGVPLTLFAYSRPLLDTNLNTFWIGGNQETGSFRGCLNRFLWTEGQALYSAPFQPPIRATGLPFPQAVVYNVSTEAAMTLGGTAQNALKYNFPRTADDFHALQPRTLPVDYPKGTLGYYIMKHEVSQGLYRDFLNTLTRLQQNNRFSAQSLAAFSTGFGESVQPVGRQSIRVVEDPGGYLPRTYACDLQPSAQLPAGVDQSQDGVYLACALISWADGAAFADWAGLRPVTEPEFEKSARGNLMPRLGAFAWGAARAELVSGLSYVGTDLERVASGNVHAADSLRISGPLRVGATARPSSGSIGSGVAPTGVYDLSGNVWEQVVSWSNPAGRSFTGLHGDGRLNARGEADVDYWPGMGGGTRTDSSIGVYAGQIGVASAAGAGMRGGGWKSPPGLLRTSDRSRASEGASQRYPDVGFRAARTHY
jgi:formylglycine-generating enzyme required for sulfatase activity